MNTKNLKLLYAKVFCVGWQSHFLEKNPENKEIIKIEYEINNIII